MPFSARRAAVAAVAVAASLAACNSKDDPATDPCAGVTFLDEAATQAEVDAVVAGDRACALVDREEGLRLVPITLGVRYTSGTNDFLTFRDPDLLFGRGDSGSPILGLDGKTLGALSGSFGGDNVLVTPMPAMRAALGGGAPAAGSAGRDSLSWFASGVPASRRAILRGAGIPLLDLDMPGASAPTLQKGALTAQASAPALAPGRSVAIVPFDGPLVRLFAIGTATHAVDADHLLALGHPLSWTGQPAHSWPVYPATVVQFVHSPLGSSKLAVPAGAIAGGVVQDRSSGIAISRAAQFARVELVVSANGSTTSHHFSLSGEASLDFGLFLAIDSVVAAHFDVGAPGRHPTTLVATSADGMTSTLDMGSVDWTQSGALPIWFAVGTELATTRKLEITVQ